MQTAVVPALSSYSSYRDSRSPLSIDQQHANLGQSSTVYVGNLSFYTTGQSPPPPLPPCHGAVSISIRLLNSRFPIAEEQIYELFSHVGDIKRIIMGLDRNTKTPCGFCFVE